MSENELITLNGVEYVRKDSPKMAFNTENLPFVIVRSYGAGVFAGYLKEQKDQEVTLLDSIRLWQWFGASLSQLSQEGTPDASKCKFAMTEIEKKVLQVIEITHCTEKARINLQTVKQWKI